jgi:hypothetical protein
MNHITDLNPHIGSEKTLVISAGDTKTERYSSFVDSVFVFNVPQGKLFRYDRHQQEILLHHICERECSQVIYVAKSTSLEHLGLRESPASIHLAIKFHLSVLLRNKEDSVIPHHIKRQMLIELYTIEQCKLLMEYFFIRKKVDHGELKVKGLVPQMSNNQFKSIFLNGVEYDNLFTMN